MTLINQIRDKSWLLLVVIGVAMFAFILGDFLSNNSALLGNGEPIVAEINGEEVTYREYNNIYQAELNNYRANAQGQQVNEFVEQSLQQSAWRKLLERYAFSNQYQELGLKVTNDELVDMVQGNNIHPSLAQQFRNQETGEVDRAAIQNYLANMDKYPPQAQAAYYNFEQQLAPERLRNKYTNLLAKTNFVTDAEAKREYLGQNTTATVQYLYVPFSSMPDSAVTVSDADLQQYYQNNIDDFTGEANRSIEYIEVKLEPTAQDIAEIKKDAEQLARQFANSQNDSAFAEANSYGSNPYMLVSKDQLPQQLANQNLEMGRVYGPYRQDDRFIIYKLIGSRNDSAGVAKASHILLKTEGKDDAEVKREANRILREVRNGKDFAAAAREYSEDFSNKNKGGDLGWFPEGRMVPEFNDAVMQASSTGVIPRLIKTQFGYHIINVTGLRDTQKYTLAKVELDITPSQQTTDQAYRKVNRFTRFQTTEEFQAAVDADSSLIRFQALTIGKNARNVNNLIGPRVRSIVRWAYSDDTEVGNVSEIYDLDNSYVIATLLSKREEGESNFEAVKDEVKQAYLKQKKAEVIKEKLSATSGTLGERQQAYGPEAKLNAADDLSLGTTSLSGVGLAADAVAAAFRLEQGAVSKPITVDNAVVIVRLENKTEATETADYNIYKTQIQARTQSTVPFQVNQAIEEQFDVKDYRYKFF